jgi:hypothetical protein
MDFTKFISEGTVILVPALYILGMVLKGTEKVSDKLIPVVLLPIGVMASCALSGASISSVIQGVLVVGTAVYTNQLVKQIKKDE